MLVLLDTGQDLAECEAELGCPVGQLLTPLTRYTLRDPSRPWAIDNGAFARFDAVAFRALLTREQGKSGCLFVTVPDVVGSARRTLEAFRFWRRNTMLAGWPLALAIQDGQESLPIPWYAIDAVFIGGSTKFKVSAEATQIIRCAQLHAKWVHVGRVNDPHRFEHFAELGVNSIDGTGIARYSHMREAIAKRDNQLRIPECSPSQQS